MLAKSYGVDESAQTTHRELIFEPISPIDPFLTVPDSHANTSTRQTQGTEFFKVVYLDSPCEHHGTTEPLRVRKKSPPSPRIAGIGPSSRKRRNSNLSLPRSPRSPLMPSSPSPGPSRTNTASTLSSPIHPQKSMSSIFISFPDEVECPTAIPGKRRAQARPSGSSELHLGMGRFALFDESVKPGPSPPCSPISSPTKRTFKVSAPDRNVQDRSQPRSPLTPSRAPRKAAKLLGAEGGYTTPLLRSSKKKEHFRPLPSQTLVEIEQFFGNVPRKQPKRAKSRQHQGDQTVEEQRTGEGRTVRHRGEDGTMWLDVEEEQEFAWFMSEMSAPMSTLPDRSGTDELLWEEGSDDEDSWGMESFTSVLTLPHSPLSGKGKGSIKLGAAPISLRAPRKRSDDSDSTVISSLRPKNRPPPLKLPFNKSATNSRLPQIAMGSPDRPKRNGSESEQPKTPFVRPRAVPPKPVAAIHLVSPVPKLQIFSMSEQDEDVSFFDPVTPIDPVSRSRPGRWLRKVAGGVRL